MSRWLLAPALLLGCAPIAAPLPAPPTPACGTPPLVARAPASSPDRALLAAGLEPYLADMVRSERSDLLELPAPFLARGRIWYLQYYGHAHPYFAQLGELPGSPTAVLARSADLVALAGKAGLRLDDDEARAAYVRTFVALDRAYPQILEAPGDLHFWVPRDVADMKVPPDLLEEMEPDLRAQVQRRREIEERYLPAVKRLCLTGVGPFRGVLHAIRAPETLVRLEVTLSKSGDVAVREVVIAEGVPVPRGYP